MATELWAVGLVLFAALAGSLGPVFLKIGSGKLHRNVKSILTNYHLFIGVGFYGIGTILFIPALRGGELSVLYPLVATTYVWVSLWSMFLLKEKMNTYKWLGVILIIVGVTCIGIGS